MGMPPLGELLGSGRSADVYAIDDDWVLRRYRDGIDATAEAAVMAHAAAHGYPVPRLRGSLPATPTDLVMQRLDGPTMLTSLQDGAATAEDAGAVLADLLHRLHAVPARASADPAHRVLHLDLHPDNVMLTADGPVVIDWCNAEDGPPDLDRAMSVLILAQVAVGASPLAAPAAAVLRVLLARLGPGAVLPAGLAEALRRRAADPAMTEAETRLLAEARALILATAPRADAGRGDGDF